MKSLRIVLVLISLVLLLVSCGGTSSSGSTSSSTPNPAYIIGNLAIGDPGLVPLVNGKATSFYVHVTNTGNTEAKNLVWSINESQGFTILDQTRATNIEAGDTGLILIKAESTGNIANAASLVLNGTANDSIPLISYAYTIPENVDPVNMLAFPNLGVFNTSLGNSNYGIFIVNQGNTPISYNTNSIIGQLPANVTKSVIARVCSNPLPIGGVCQINLNATANLESGATTLIPQGTSLISGSPIPTQVGGVLTLESTIVGHVVLLPASGLTIDGSASKVTPGIGYIVNTGANTITNISITTDNTNVQAQAQCTSLVPGGICPYSLNTSAPASFTMPGSTIVTVNYNNSIANSSVNTVSSWSYIPKVNASHPSLTFVQYHPIDLYQGNSSVEFMLENSGDVPLSDLTLPKVNIPSQAGSISINIDECPSTLQPSQFCIYTLNYTAPRDPVLWSGVISGVTASYAGGSYTMSDLRVLEVMANESQALSFSNNTVLHETFWSDPLTESSIVKVSNVSNSVITNLVANTGGSGWITASGCPSRLAANETCLLTITTTAVAPGINDSSDSGALNLSYNIAGKPSVSQDIAVSYHVKAKPIITPNVAIAPLNTSAEMLTNDTTQAYGYTITNNTTATNGGDTDAHIDISSLQALAAVGSGLTFVVNVESNLTNCLVSGNYFIVHSGTTCSYTVVINSASNFGTFDSFAAIKSYYATYSDTSTAPNFSDGFVPFSQSFNVKIDQRTAQLNIINQGVNNFNNMTLDQTYVNHYTVKNVGNTAVNGGLTFNAGGLPGKISVADLSACNNLAPSQTCTATVTYVPSQVINNASLESASLGFNNKVVDTSDPFPGDPISAVSATSANIAVSTSLTACQLGDGKSVSGTCYMNTGTQVSSFQLTVTLTNIGERTANDLSFNPNNFSSAWKLEANNCAATRLGALDQCSIVYRISDPNVSGDYALSTKAILGQATYQNGTAETNTINIVPDSNLYIEVNSPTLTTSLLSPARLESSVTLLSTLSNYYSGSASANLTTSDTGLILSGYVCNFSIAAGTTGGICNTTLTPNTQIIVAASGYNIALASSWTKTESAAANVSFGVKAPLFSSTSAGYGQTCAVSKGNNTYCWGLNNFGQLGNNRQGFNESVPTLVGGVLTGITSSISVGQFYACATTTNGNAFCWGRNNVGQLGNGELVTEPSPSQVIRSDSGNFTNISAGIASTCAIATNGAFCWGANTKGQLGTGTVENYKIQPAKVVTTISGGFSSVSVGHEGACGVAANGAFCWGYNGYGQLGNNQGYIGAYESQPVAVVLPSGKTFTSISAGSYFACAVANDSTGYCWGYNTYGQLGNGDYNAYNLPQAIKGVSFKNIIAGQYSTCGITNSGQAYCWGQNSSGQLGGSPAISPGGTSNIPVAVNNSLFQAPTLLTPGSSHTCGNDANGDLYCWGQNNYGQLGNGVIDFNNVQSVPLPIN